MDWASRIPPSAPFAIAVAATGSKLIPSSLAMWLSCSAMTFVGILLRSNLWHLEIIVGNILVASVVAKINFTCSGGSSSVLRRALNAAFESMCTSSI